MRDDRHDAEIDMLVARLGAAVIEGWAEELTSEDWERLRSYPMPLDSAAREEFAHRMCGHTRTYDLAPDVSPTEAADLLFAALGSIKLLTSHLHWSEQSYAAARRVAFRVLGLPLDADDSDPHADLHSLIECQCEGC